MVVNVLINNFLCDRNVNDLMFQVLHEYVLIN